MIALIIYVLLVIVFVAWLVKVTEDIFIGMVIGTLLSVLGLMPLVIVINFTGGLIDDYSSGSRSGYITKLSESGIFVKTWDGEMQVGTGNLAALQEPFQFSVPNQLMRDVLNSAANDGTRVRLTYRQYFIANYYEGGTSYIITAVDSLE